MMLNNNKKGSTLVAFLILLSPLLLYLLINIRGNHMGNQKVYQQTQNDALVLHYASYQIDALNAIAMYNKGIEITATRAYLVATALMLLRACAIATLLKSPCTRYWAKLEKKAPAFFNKANQLMAYYAQQQDYIKAWAEQIPYQDLMLLNAKNTLKQKTFYKLFPQKKYYTLPIIRDTQRTMNKDNPLYQGNDFQRCHIKIEKNLLTLNSKIIPYKSRHNLSLEVLYKNPNSGAHTTKHYSSLRGITMIPKYFYSTTTQQRLTFNHAKIKKCEHFKNFINQLKGKVNPQIHVPPFYVLNDSYIKQGLSLKLTAKHLHKNIADKPIRKLAQILINQQTVLNSASKACIKGYDLFNADFDAHLCSLQPGLKP